MALCALCAAPADTSAQNGLSLQVGGSQVAPPAGLEGEPGRFAVGGVRLSDFRPGGSGYGGFVLVGRSLDAATGGDFVSAGFDATGVARLSEAFSFEVDARVFGFDVDAPFPYRAYGIEGGPALVLRSGAVRARVRGTAGTARSRVEFHQTRDFRGRVIEDDLWRYGGSAELLVGSRSVMAGVSGGIHRTAGGTYETGGVRLLVAGSTAVAELRADVWNTPVGRETTGGVAFSVSLEEVWSLRGFLGRSEPDPLTLAEPGGGSGGILVGRRIFALGPAGRRPPLHEVVGSVGIDAQVRVRLRPPAGAQAVELLGDFTLWDPVPMVPDGGWWVVVVKVPPGTHHFGFLVDGQWYVPDDAPDLVPDEWGRSNATMVIEANTPSGASSEERY